MFFEMCECELLAFRLKEKNLLEQGTKIIIYRATEKGLLPFFSQENNFVFCNKPRGLLGKIGSSCEFFSWFSVYLLTASSETWHVFFYKMEQIWFNTNCSLNQTERTVSVTKSQKLICENFTVSGIYMILEEFVIFHILPKDDTSTPYINWMNCNLKNWYVLSSHSFWELSRRESISIFQ